MAQTTPAASAALWSKLQAVDARINACHVVWQRTATNKPQPKVDPEKAAVRSMELARQRGETPAEAEKSGAQSRALSQEDVKGYAQRQTLAYVRVGATIKCEVETYARTQGTSLPGRSLGRDIDFYDGKNAVTIPIVEGDKLPPRGQLVRDDKEILAHSGGGFAGVQLFVGAPLTQLFSPTDSTLREAADGTLILEKKVKARWTYLMRVTLGKEHLRPIKFEAIDVSWAPNNVTRLTRVATGYRRYAGGAWFPSKIVTDRGFGSEEDVLLKAAFNEAVDPLELRLPPGATLADARFGEGKVVGYKLKNGQIRSDDEVRKMLSPDKEAAKAKDAASKEAADSNAEQSSLPLAPVAGLMFMAMGGMMWVRSGKRIDSAEQK